jgi:transposase
MTRLTIDFTEVKKGIADDETGLGIELQLTGEKPTKIERKQADEIAELIRIYMTWATETQCCRSAHMDGNASKDALDSFIKGMWIETIDQRRERLKE